MTNSYEFTARLLESRGDPFVDDDNLILSWIPARDLELSIETLRIMGLMTGTYSDEYVLAVDQFIRAMEGIGQWQNLDYFYFFQAANEVDALINWRPSPKTAVNTGAIFNPYAGFTPTTGGVIDTNVAPSAVGSYSTQNAMFGFYTSTDPDLTNTIDLGVKDTTAGSDAYFSIDDKIGRINGVQDVTATLTKERGMFVIERTGDQTGDVDVYEDGVSLGATAAAVLATANLPDFNMVVGGVNNGGTIESETSRVYCAAFMGSAFAAAEYFSFHSALLALMQASHPVSLPTITENNPTQGAMGSTVIVTGTGFLETENVVFNDVNFANETEAASFRINSDTELEVVVHSLYEATFNINVVKKGVRAQSPTNFIVDNNL